MKISKSAFLYKKESGFSITQIILVVFVLGVVGLVGYRVLITQKNNITITPTNSSQKSTTQPNNLTADKVAPITNKTELNKASTSLDSSNIDSDLETQSLDSDINSLL